MFLIGGLEVGRPPAIGRSAANFNFTFVSEGEELPSLIRLACEELPSLLDCNASLSGETHQSFLSPIARASSIDATYAFAARAVAFARRGPRLLTTTFSFLYLLLRFLLFFFGLRSYMCRRRSVSVCAWLAFRAMAFHPIPAIRRMVELAILAMLARIFIPIRALLRPGTGRLGSRSVSSFSFASLLGSASSVRAASCSFISFTLAAALVFAVAFLLPFLLPPLRVP